MFKTAKAHTRPTAKYSSFHTSLLHQDEKENYALRHLYSLKATQQILADKDGFNWTEDQIKEASDYIVIDVREYVVRVYVPWYRWVKVPVKELKNYSSLNPDCKVIDSALYFKKPMRGLSTFISKKTYLNLLVEEKWKQADPYKLMPVEGEFDRFSASGNTGDVYQLSLHNHHINCDCHAYSGVSKAFNQDKYALSLLQNHPIYEGQTPDKHVFAIWKYLNAYSLGTYSEVFLKRQQLWAGGFDEVIPISRYRYG